MATEYQRYLRANITSEMLKQGLEQEQLARWINRSQPALNDRLLGRTDFRIGELILIAEHLSVPLQRFFDGIHTEDVQSKVRAS